MAQQPAKLPRKGFYRIQQVLALIPICESAWGEGCRIGRFPKPVKLGRRTTARPIEEIEELMERLANGESDVR